MIAFDDAPLKRIHLRVMACGTGGQFSDGYSLGIIGIVLSMATGPLHLDSWWIGALGTASLVGLFAGSSCAGPLIDRIGRRPIFAWDMLVFALFAVLQFRVHSAGELLVIRLLLGFSLGFDYVTSNALITETSPTRTRGRLLSVLAVAWASGYVCAYFVGYVVRNGGPDAWRWALLSSAVPSGITFLFRLGIPESVPWLASKGYTGKARAIIDRYIGADVALPLVAERPEVTRASARSLFTSPLRQRLLIGCLFYTAQVIPFFSLGTYLPIVMTKLGVEDAYTGGLIFNILLLGGSIVGLLIIDRITRRSFLVGAFILMAALMALLGYWHSAPSLVIIGIFASFAFVLSAAANLEFVYPPELFPTEVRGTGVGMVIACSRVGSAFSTFLLPTLVDRYGIHSSLVTCMAIMIAAAVACQIWAPKPAGSS